MVQKLQVTWPKTRDCDRDVHEIIVDDSQTGLGVSVEGDVT